MVRQDLVNLLKTYLSQGYQKEQLYSSLLSQGYNAKELQVAFRQIEYEQKRIIISSIKQWQKQGHTIDEIKQWLLSQNYPQQIVDELLSKIKTGHSFTSMLLGIIIIIIATFLIITYLIPSETTNTPPSSSQPPSEEPSPPSQQPSFNDTYFIKDNNTISNITQTNKNNTPEQGLKNCELLSNDKDKDNCKLALAEDKEIPSVCRYISNPAVKDKCYLHFIYQGDTEQCLFIELPENKDICKILEEY